MQVVVGQFVVVVPVKSPEDGKSRLLGVADRAGLAAAFATDMVSACLRSPRVDRVLVTTDDGAFATSLAELGAETTRDPGAGLNAALRDAAAIATRRWPHLRAAAVLADLPALAASDLTEALDAVAAHGPEAACYVADADGTGTVLYSAAPSMFDPRFGADSAHAHAEAGAIAIPGGMPTLRRDVDDLGSLRHAKRLGLGRATAALMRGSSAGHASTR